MRPSLPLQKSFPWLTGLKSVQLQRVARATGIQSSGTNSVLVSRIQSTLLPYLNHHENIQPMSILSIDMGIQNLAFAHLRVSNKPELTAWRRLAMSDITNLDFDLDPTMKLPTEKDPKEETIPEKISKEGFCPARYASNAYTLVDKLLSAYKPTHILIERQRFRSAGGSAVQEWTLRVGVMEGMLYAVLYALKQERGGGVSRMEVHGIEPKRVVKYWIDREGGVKMSAREVKKAKIEIVGGFLEGGRVIPEGGVRDLVDGYLGKLHGEGKGKGNGLGKLDDLADCLLQGVTWLEWEGMRGRLAREGMEALEGR